MNEEKDNIENTENFKTVVVAQDGSGDYESIEEALFLEGEDINLKIVLTKGEYSENLVISRKGKTYIEGMIGCVFLVQDKIPFTIVRGSLDISRIIFHHVETNIVIINESIESSKPILSMRQCQVFSQGKNDLIRVKNNNLDGIILYGNLFIGSYSHSIINVEGVSVPVVIKNNHIIAYNALLDATFSDVYGKIYNNIIYEVKDFLFDFLTNNVENTAKNLEIMKNINHVGNKSKRIELHGLLNVILPFHNEYFNDYRIFDSRYKDYGVPNEVLEFFMGEKSEIAYIHKPRLLTKEILIYTDTSLFKKEFENFITQLKKDSEIKNIIPIHSVKELQEQKAISTLVLVSPVDKSENDNEIFEILEEAKKQKKQIFIFLADIKKHTGDKMNIAKMPQVLETHNKLREEENVSFYENTEQLEEIIYQRLQTNFPNVTLEKLVLKNIGHFSDLKIDFEESNQNAYCFIGTNGTGKTSILRAIILGLIGTSSKSLELDKLNSLVKIYGLENGIVKRENAFIELHYLVDNKKEYNKVSCLVAKDGKLEWKEEGDFALLDESFLESLIIGFSQLRGERGTNGNKETNRQLRPHVSDLLPLVHNEVDGRLSDFSRWIIDLYAKANEKEVRINRQENSTKKETEILERTTINLVFEIVSQLLDQKIKFKEVRDNNEVWVCTELAENGIPISLVSQGFNTIIGWIGGLLQRMQEVYGLHALGRKKEFQTYPAFCLIDELDPHLHPKVQANLMNVLNKYFPNTLFVFSTHSPLIIPYLEKENVFMLTEDGQVSNAHIHTKGRSYQSILLDFMNVAERPKEYAQKLEDLYRLIDDENIEEANKKLAELIKDFGGKDPEILRAQTMIDFIED